MTNTVSKVKMTTTESEGNTTNIQTECYQHCPPRASPRYKASHSSPLSPPLSVSKPARLPAWERISLPLKMTVPGRGEWVVVVAVAGVVVSVGVGRVGVGVGVVVVVDTLPLAFGMVRRDTDGDVVDGDDVEALAGEAVC